MKINISVLRQVQELDAEIYTSRQLVDDIPDQIKQLDQELESHRHSVHAAEEALKALQLQQRKEEADLQDKEAAIKKYEIQLDQVKTNKEYASLQSEIRSLKADNSLLEEHIIELLDQVDECQDKVKSEQLKLAEIEKNVNEKKRALEENIKEVKRKIEELHQKKKELIKGVQPEVASLYEKIVQAKRGLALVKVDSEVCPACQMRLRPQQLNEIKKAEQVVLCEQCSRILYCD